MSSESPSPDGPAGQAPQPKQGMSTGTKILLIVVAVLGFGTISCCGGCLFLGYQMTPEIDRNPAAVRAETERVAEITILDGFEPTMVMRMNMLIANMRMVAYEWSAEGEDVPATLVLAQMEMAFGGAQQKLEQSIRKNLSGQEFNSKKLSLKSAENRTFQIRGKEVTVRFAKAEAKDGTAYRQVTGTFPGRDSGTAFLKLQMKEQLWDEEKVEAMIKSIE
jgi:hypothetical protein